MSQYLKYFLFLVLFSQTLLFSMSKTEDLPSEEFASRRLTFIEELRSLNACAILHTAPLYERNHHVEYPYRQDSDFFYLTGWTQPGAILVITPQENPESQPEITLFVTPLAPKKKVWTGPKPGLGEARNLPGIDLVWEYDDFFDHLGKLIAGYDRLALSFGEHSEFKDLFEREFDAISKHPSITQEATALLQYYRLIKSEIEIEALETAIDITRLSLLDALPLIPKLQFEYEVQAELEYGFSKRGSVRLGFPSIVGAGVNTTYLHYEDNHGRLRSGSMLLMDIGAEWDYYTADISRTVPISGKFNPEQKQIYELVLKAQLKAIEGIKPGIAFREPHRTAVRVLTQGLIDLDLLEGDVDDLIRDESYRKFYMHGTSHWLGLDVHDVGGRVDVEGKPHTLKAGMVLTVEPGIYISENEDIDSRWWNIGIRIEDDVLVTQNGYRVLSQSIPKTIKEIEGLMQP